MQFALVTGSALLLLSLLQAQVCSAADGDNWGYSAANGPMNWPALVPKWCSGRRQSPINIQMNSAIFDTNLIAHTIMHNHSHSVNYTLTNNGAGLLMQFSDSVKVQMGTSPKSCYMIEQMHWHWGSTSYVGSEHWVEGKQYPMEGHMVMWNCEMYKNFSEAATSFEGLAVLGVLYEESSTAPSTTGMQSLVLALQTHGSGLKHCNSSCMQYMIPAFNVTDLLPTNTRDYYMYPGSLTTPDCRENVLWTVYRETLKVSSELLRQFRMVMTKDSTPAYNNYRYPLPLNPIIPVGGMRMVTRSFGGATTSPIASSAEGARAGGFLVAAVAVAVSSVLAF